MSPERESSQVLPAKRGKSEQGNDKAVPVSNGVGHAKRHVTRWFDVIHERLPKG
jgi:hypothetical protein